jgi:methionyl-tRNA synthetase
MIDKYFGGQVPDPFGRTALADHDWPAITAALITGTDGSVQQAQRFHVNEALRSAVELIRKVDGYINITAPFKLAKHADTDPLKKAELAVILYHCAEAIRIAAYLFWPAMPAKMDELLTRWGCTSGTEATSRGYALNELVMWGGPHSLKPGGTILKGETGLFNRADPAEPAPGSPSVPAA